MNFGYVEGLCVLIQDGTEPVVRVTIYLETTMGIEIIRELESVADPRPDAAAIALKVS